MSANDPQINPYAPPSFVAPSRVEHELNVWREDNQLVIRLGAVLPRLCIVNGGPAPYEHPISQIWQPRWVYSLLIFAVLPYFIFSPFLHRRVELMVPFSRTIYRKHLRWVNVGIISMIVGVILVCGFIACTLGEWLSGPVAAMLVVGVFMFLIGLQIAGRQPMRLNIVRVEQDLVYVEDVHPSYLDRLPNLTAPFEAEQA